MIEYLRTDNLPLTVSYTASSYATNVYFEIYDLDTEEFIQSGAGTYSASTVSSKTYNIGLNVDATSYDRNIKIEFVTTSSVGAYNDIEYASLIRPYASPDRILELADIPASASANTNLLRKLEKKARLSLNSYIGDSFYKEKRTITVFGQNSDIITTPIPIQRIDKVYEDDLLVYERDNSAYQLDFPLEIDSSGTRVKIVNSSTNNKEILEFPKFSVFYYEGIFKKDFSYKIDGIWGWEYIPAYIELATAQLVEDYLCNDFNVRNKNIGQLSNDSYNIKYGSNFSTGTGNLLVDNLIAKYKEARYMVV
jgi:hypothetical protein